jgi:hypothetical protein
MGDGNKKRKGLVINTQSFNLKEVILLANILRLKFNLNPKIQLSIPDKSIYKNYSLISGSTTEDKSTNYKIYLNSADLNMIRPLIKPYFVNHFLYKIN